MLRNTANAIIPIPFSDTTLHVRVTAHRQILPSFAHPNHLNQQRGSEGFKIPAPIASILTAFVSYMATGVFALMIAQQFYGDKILDEQLRDELLTPWIIFGCFVGLIDYAIRKSNVSSRGIWGFFSEDVTSRQRTQQPRQIVAPSNFPQLKHV